MKENLGREFFKHFKPLKNFPTFYWSSSRTSIQATTVKHLWRTRYLVLFYVEDFEHVFNNRYFCRPWRCTQIHQGFLHFLIKLFHGTSLNVTPFIPAGNTSIPSLYLLSRNLKNLMALCSVYANKFHPNRNTNMKSNDTKSPCLKVR